MKKAILLILFLSFTTGCKQIAFAAYGIKKPKPISTDFLNKKYTKHGLKSDLSLTITEEGFYRYANTDFAINNLFIYTTNGKVILPRDSSSCSGKIEQFVNVFRDSTQVEFQDTDSTNYFNAYFRSLAGNELNIKPDKKYIAVVYWATFTGRLNKDLSAAWANKLYAYPDVQVLCVSLDLQDYWSESIPIKD